MKTKNFTDIDKKWMALAFKEATAVKGNTLPNPPVGAVLVKAGKVIGKGGTSIYGGPHGEINAINSVPRNNGALLHGAAMYVTLEPCSHWGMTPPCVDAIIKAGISKVYISVLDPNPLIHQNQRGSGVHILEKAGIQVKCGLLKKKGDVFYESFFYYLRYRQPKIILKIAQSSDGNIAAKKGLRTQITGKESQRWTHTLRAHSDAIVVGMNTVRVDDPQLTPRLSPMKRKFLPDVWVLSKKGIVPQKTLLFKDSDTQKKDERNQNKGIDIKVFPKVFRAKSFSMLHKAFHKKGYHQVLVEGGASVLQQWLESGHWDEFYILTAKTLLPGGVSWKKGLSQAWDKGVEYGKLKQKGKDGLLKLVNQRTSDENLKVKK